MTDTYSVTARPGLGVVGEVGRGRGYVAKTLTVRTELEREPISVDLAAMSCADLLPILGGTSIPACLDGGRDLLLPTEPTD